MTTIATDGNVIAADGMVSCDGKVVSENYAKVVRLASGQLVACCGPSGEDRPFWGWLEGGEKFEPSEGFAAIVLAPGAKPRVYFQDLTFEEFSGAYAIGSGRWFALTAMDCGKTPKEAVRIAAKRCCYTGGKIMEMRL